MRSGNKELRQLNGEETQDIFPIQFTRGHRVGARLTPAPAGIGMTSSTSRRKGVDGLVIWSVDRRLCDAVLFVRSEVGIRFDDDI